MSELDALFSKAQSGDLEAYDLIVRRFQDMAVGYAYSVLGDFHLAEDAAQEAFVEAGARLETVYGPLAFPGFLRKIIFKYCDRLTRRKGLKTVPLGLSTPLEGFEPDPQTVLERRDMGRRIWIAIQALPEASREVITLFYISDYSQKEISAFLGVPVSTVKKRLYDGRKQLRDLLTERESAMATEKSERREYKNEDYAKRQQKQWKKKGYKVMRRKNVLYLHFDLLEIEIGNGLIPLVDPNQEGGLLDRVKVIRKRTDLGVVVPQVRIRDNNRLKPNVYTIKIRGVRVANGELQPKGFLAMDPGRTKGPIEGTETKEPVFGLPVRWISGSNRARAELLGYTVVGPDGILATHLWEVIKSHAHEFPLSIPA